VKKVVQSATVTGLATVVLALSACASGPEQVANKDRDEPEYVTGSMLPKKDKNKTAEMSEADKAALRNAVQPTFTKPPG